jgi:hypothetical protein
LDQSNVSNVIYSHKLERDMQMSLSNLHKFDCAGKPVPTFPHPALKALRFRQRVKMTRKTVTLAP